MRLQYRRANSVFMCSSIAAFVFLSVFCSTTFAEKLASAEAPQQLMQSPAGEKYPHLNPTGTSILPNGRLITPRGQMIRVKPHPYGMTSSPDWVVTVSSDGPQLSLLDLNSMGENKEAQVYRIPKQALRMREFWTPLLWDWRSTRRVKHFMWLAEAAGISACSI